MGAQATRLVVTIAPHRRALDHTPESTQRRLRVRVSNQRKPVSGWHRSTDIIVGAIGDISSTKKVAAWIFMVQYTNRQIIKANVIQIEDDILETL